MKISRLQKTKRHVLRVSKIFNLGVTGKKNDLRERILNRRNITVPGIESPENVDILVIPGVARKEDTEIRKNFEERLLQKFFRLKRIILLCGGVFRLECLGVTIGSVRNHSNSYMVSLNSSAEVIYNTQIHMALVEDNDTARTIFGDIREFSVNSVHSEAITVLGSQLHDDVDVVVRSGDPIPLDDGQVRKNRRKSSMDSDTNVIEAIRTKCTLEYPPLLAVQWHPEAYHDTIHVNPHFLLLNSIYSWEPRSSDDPLQDVENLKISG